MKYISYKNSTLTEQQRQQHNNNYINKQLKEKKEYFDNMFKKIDPNIKLDQEQRKIILTDEDYLMVIAGAGAGKTTTITAKVNYLIQQTKIKDNEIVIITFTNKAVQELKERINNDFKHNIKITTFHKFGYEIIKDNTNPPPKIINNPDILIKEYIEKKLLKDKHKIKQLKKYLKIKNKKQDEITNKIKNYCRTFINLIKSKGLTQNDIDKIKTKNKKEKEITNILKQIYEYYENILKNINKIDFDDMINKATNIINTNETTKMKYKYIIIDEYQDISECRFNLINTISKKNNSKIMIVGDDWQCIYGFAASNINLFTQFKQRINQCETLKIQNTYRNSQQLIDIAGKFIQKNSKQIKKQLKSKKQHSNPVKIIKYKRTNKTKKFIQILDYIIKKYGKQKNILILGRYTFDKNEIIDTKQIIENNNKIIYKKYPNVKIDYMTIHSSKGLGYDNVILINTKNDKLGFPSKIKTDPIISQLITKEKTIKYPEERRLFYVALTRTKNEIIIMTPKIKQSKFIKEIKKYKNVTIKSNIKKQNQ